MVMWRPTLNKDKYKQAILFLLNSSVNNALLGKVKLFKLLYYIDFDHYQKFKAPITGDVYRKLPFGPVPDRAQEILSEMVDDELIQISTKLVGNYTQYQFTPLEREPNLEDFAPSEITILEQVVNKWGNRTTNDIVGATHGEAPWRAVNLGAEIPYALAFYRRDMLAETPNSYEDLEELAMAN